jgi:hypothetical protein
VRRHRHGPDGVLAGGETRRAGLYHFTGRADIARYFYARYFVRFNAFYTEFLIVFSQFAFARRRFSA